MALADMIGTVVFMIACLYLARRAKKWVDVVDKRTVEVSDYTVVVKGLPETDPIQVKRHIQP
jgi:hypothetical protein